MVVTSSRRSGKTTRLVDWICSQLQPGQEVDLGKSERFKVLEVIHPNVKIQTSTGEVRLVNASEIRRGWEIS